MRVKFEAVLDGMAEFMNKEIYPGMTDWQEIIARVTVGQIFENRATVKESFINNGLIRTFGIIDENGDVEIDRLASSLRTEIQRKEKLSFKVPLFGTLTFHPSDVDSLYEMITGTTLINEITEVTGNEIDQ